MQSFARAILLSVAAATLNTLTVGATPGLKLYLGGPTDVVGADSFIVQTTLQNTGDEDLTLYNEPRGVLNPIPTRSFRLAKAGGGNHAPQFIGLVAKYSFSLASSFTTLRVGENVTVDHELSRAFAFDSLGTYSVSPTTTFYIRGPDGSPTPIEAEFERPHTAKLSGTLKSRWVEKRQEKYNTLMKRSIPDWDNAGSKGGLKAEGEKRNLLRKRQTSFANCTSAQESQIQASAYVASLYVADAEKYLTLNTASTPRYTEWFGAFDEERHATVLNHYATIRASDVKTYTFDCGCEEGDDIYAYVYPDEFGHVYLCHQYMIAEVSGTDSKAGTIVHESTHFTRNAGTLDISYGQGPARELAQTNATLAIRNADSHEYFAENTPALA